MHFNDFMHFHEVLWEGMGTTLGLRQVGRIAVTTREVSRRWVLFTVLCSLNLLDLIFTHVGIQRGVLVEKNPLMQRVVENLWTAATVKIVALAIVGGLLYAIRRRTRLVELTLAICIGWYLVVVCWNYSLIVS